MAFKLKRFKDFISTFDIPKNINGGKSLVLDGVDLSKFAVSLIEYCESQGVNLTPLPKITFSDDAHKKDQGNFFSRTGYYEPSDNSIHIIYKNRHPKDVLRTLAHELIHHSQRLKGIVKKGALSQMERDPGFSSKIMYMDNHPEKSYLEGDAFLRSNLLFRSWHDQMAHKFGHTKNQWEN